MLNKARLQTNLIAGAAAAVLGVVAVVFLALAAYLGLLYAMDPALAALTTGAALILLALVAAAAPRWYFRRRDRRQPPADPQSELDMIEQALRDHVDELVAQGVRRYPSRATIGTLLLGLAAGYGSSALNGRGRTSRRHGPHEGPDGGW